MASLFYLEGIYYKTKTHDSMPSGDYDLPPVDSTSGKMLLPEYEQHPRLLFTADQLPAIRTTFNASANAAKKQTILNKAASGTSFTIGNSGSHSFTDSGVTYTYLKQDKDDILDVLAIIEAKAFMYQISESDQYGLEAIRMMKDFLSVIEDVDDGNRCRVFGEGMFVAALVYDWCYDLLGPDDRAELIRGVQEKLCKPLVPHPDTRPGHVDQLRMEVNFPPNLQGAISDHGCERQILRDYLAFSIAIFDQDRSWYDYVAGRIYEEYVPVRNYYYESGYSPQGISTYLDMRFGSDIWSAWLLKTATGVLPYNGENMQKVMHTAYAHVTEYGDDGVKIFSSGDEESHCEWQESSGMARLKQLATAGMISGYLFNDPTPMRWAAYSDYGYVEAPRYMILKSSGVDSDPARRYDNLALITYNGGFLGQMIAHKAFGNNKASVFMKIGNRTTSGHDHADAGSFQIYYRGLLAGDAGYYDRYNSQHWANYHQSTIAHNSIVLMRGTDETYTVLQQKRPGETRSFDSGTNPWLGDTYKTGETTGHAYGYDNGVPTYAYIAGDIADAYDPDVISRLDRRMLTVFDTDRSDVQLYFFVFDYVVSKNANDKKAFLIHTLFDAPTIDEDTNSATIINGQGKLVVQPVHCGSGGATLTAVPCRKANGYNVGGTSYPTENNKDDCYWGWLQISPSTNEKYTPMLTVMFVGDKWGSPTAETLPAYHFSNTKVQGAAIGNTIAVFVAQEDPIAESVGFYTTGVPSSGNDERNYYVSNVAAGNWVVHSSNGTEAVTATEEGHFLTFSAPTGTIVLEYLGAN